MGLLKQFRILKWTWLILPVLECFSALGADLAPYSPFLSQNLAAAASVEGPKQPIELRGIMSTSDGTLYCIYDSAKKTDTWVGLGEKGYDFLVKSADVGSDGVTVDFGGRGLHLALRTSKVAPAVTSAIQGLNNVNGASSGFSSTQPQNPGAVLDEDRVRANYAKARRNAEERQRMLSAGGADQSASSPTP